MPDRQIIQVPFTRLDEGKKMVYGYASTGRVDTYNTIFEPSWWPQAVIGYTGKLTMSEMHLDLNGDPQSETAREPMVVGTVPMIECDERGLWVGAEITSDDAWQKITSGDYNGFSISAMPYEYRQETVNGRNVTVFTKYQLSDITVGYPAANLDAKFQLIESRLATDADSPWVWDWAADADAIVNQLGWEGLAQACMYQDPAADPKTKAAYKLPVMKMKNGALCLYWNGVRAAMARLLGGGGKMDLTDADRKTIYNKLVKLYKKFDKEPPEFRLDTGGIMSTFGEKVKELVKRLAGKEPDAQTIQEIAELETRLAGEQAQQVRTLGETVAAVTARLDKVELASTSSASASAADPKDAKIAELTVTVAAIEPRLAAVEKAAARSQQVGESGKDGEKGKIDMNREIRARMGIKAA